MISRINTARILIAVSVMVFLPSLSTADASDQKPLKIEIFTDGDHPINNISYMNNNDVPTVTKQYELDDVFKMEKSISKGLPADKDKAMAMVKQRFQEQGGFQAVMKQVEIAYKGILYAYRYKLKYYPAVVFNNGEAVVYGVTDMHQAMDKYLAWRQRSR